MTDAPPALRPDVARAAELARSIRDEIRKVLVGQDAVVDQVLVALFAAGHVLIEGAPAPGASCPARARPRSARGRP